MLKPDPVPQVRPLHVLLVEDDDDHAELVLYALRQHAPFHSPARVSDGAQALAYLWQQAPYTEARRPDLMLLDLNLPRLSGLDVLEQVKSDDGLRTIPVVILTTSSSEPDRRYAYARHANSYLVKPASFERFEALVNQLCDYWGRWNLGL